MQIKEAKIYNFGKLQNKTYSFAPGINLIYGENEAGKTTLHMFLKSMLFGLERPRGRSARGDDYTRYEPWHAPSYYSGALRFTVAKQPFFLERNFYSKEKKELLRNERDGEELSVACGDLEMLLGGISKETYENTYDIAQCGVATSAQMRELLAEYLSDAAGSGDASLRVRGALQTLEQKRKERQAQLKKCRAEKEEHRKRLLIKRDLLEKEWRGQQALLEQALQTGECEESGQELSGSESERAEDNLREDNLLGSEPGQFENNLFGSEPERAEDNLSVRRKRAWGLRVAAATMLTINIVAFCLGYRNAAVFGVSELALTAGWALLEVFLRRRGAHRNADVSTRRAAASEDNTRGKADTRRTDCMEPESTAFREDCRESGDAARLRERRLEQLCERLGENVQEKEVQLVNLDEEIAALDWMDARERELSEDVQALELAASQIAKLSEEFCEDIKDELDAEISKQISLLTGGKYDRITVEADGKFEVYADGRTVRPEQLSRGTYEQFYLALRLAVGEVMRAEEPLPIMLDEVFSMYDESRLEQALRILNETGHQILLFTCQRREEDQLMRLGIPYHKIQL